LPRRAVSVLLLERHGEVLVEKRPATGVWAGLWSLPELGLDADIVSHCRARFAAEVALQPALPVIEHGFTHFRLTLHPRPCAVREWPRRAEEPGLLWLPLTDIGSAALPSPIKKLLRGRARL
jgi:A/G-specific adenine glycosylase